MSQISVTDVAQAISVAGKSAIQNLSSVPIVFAREATVTASGSTGGFRLDPGATYDFDKARVEYNSAYIGIPPLYVVCATGQTATLAYGAI